MVEKGADMKLFLRVCLLGGKEGTEGPEGGVQAFRSGKESSKRKGCREGKPLNPLHSLKTKFVTYSFLVSGSSLPPDCIT